MFDFNDISDIGQWIKGSVINDNLPSQAPPDFIIDDLKKLF